ncbi:UNVERIFIED_CONTAM: hypothetical protein PYX00_009244 [Menopon gallinae]|uniref:Uncharacterized protein n=1 Tax=Menopon gallinae TaxID=328185 RepID=A0AAW2HAK5_9NEOP
MTSNMTVDLQEENEVLDFDKICRLCLLEKTSMLRIFAKKKQSNITPLPIRIMSCASLEVYQGDGLPSKICPKCLWNVNQAYTFREQCDAANTRLQKYLHRLKNASNPSSNQAQDNIENENQEAIPLEYLDAQITISEQPTGSVHIKNEESLDIKSEPDSSYDQQTLVEGDNEQDRDNDDDEEEDDKPISELMNYSRANNESLTENAGDDEQKEKVDENEEGTDNKPKVEILQTPKPTRRFFQNSEYAKDPTYSSHKKFYIVGSEYNKLKKKPKQEKAPKLKIVKTQNLKIKKENPVNGETWENLFDMKPRRKYAPRDKNLISNNSDPIIEQDGSKSKFRACTHCGKVVLGKNMGIHVKIHVGNKSHLCDICGKSFLYKKTLETHKRVHSGERPCVCKICGKTFRSSSRLSDHMSTHTGRKPFICEICAVAFRIKGHLKKHLRVHSGEKPYICTFCEKAFSDAWNMKCHLRIHTGEKPPHSCPVCGQCFLRRNKMEEHCKVTHGEEYVLPRKQNIVQRLKNDLVEQNEELRQITEREREDLLRQETERQLLQSHLESQRQELAERFSESHLPISVPMPIPVPVPAFPGNIPSIFGLQ